MSSKRIKSSSLCQICGLVFPLELSLQTDIVLIMNWLKLYTNRIMLALAHQTICHHTLSIELSHLPDASRRTECNKQAIYQQTFPTIYGKNTMWCCWGFSYLFPHQHFLSFFPTFSQGFCFFSFFLDFLFPQS